MEERIDDEIVVIAAQADCRTPGLEGANILAVTGDHTLGVAGGAGGKQDIQRVLGRQGSSAALHLRDRYRLPQCQERLPRLALRHLFGEGNGTL